MQRGKFECCLLEPLGVAPCEYDAGALGAGSPRGFQPDSGDLHTSASCRVSTQRRSILEKRPRVSVSGFSTGKSPSGPGRGLELEEVPEWIRAVTKSPERVARQITR